MVANSEDGTVSILLNEGGTFIDVDKSKRGWERDDELTLRVTVQGSVLPSVVPTGAITVKDGSQVLRSVALKDGKASITIEDFKEGPQNVQVVYSGDSRFNPNEATVPIRDGSDPDNDETANHSKD